MAKKDKIPEKYRVWIDARKKHKLSHALYSDGTGAWYEPKKFRKS